MAPPVNTRIITNTEVSKINYGKSFNVLERANADRYLQTVSSRDILKESLNQTDLYERAEKVLTEPDDINTFLTMLANMYQSVTTKGLTAYEILTYVIVEILRIGKKNSLLNNENFIEVVNQTGISMPVFIKDFSDNKNFKYLISDLGLNAKEEEFAKKHIIPSFTFSRGSFGMYGAQQQIITNKNRYYDIAEMLNFPDSAESTLSVNEDIKTCNKQSPNFSVILLNNRNLRSGLKNGLEISSFFNLISTLELSKAYPYFNATFILPSVSKQDKKSVFKTATLNQFLFGFEQRKSKNFNSFEGKIKKNESSIGVETNLSIFTTPQTVVNLNEKIGHSDILNKEEKKLRITSVHDSTRPFMTLKDFTIDVAPTKGLMSFKTGKISLILHDRTRMGDIAPFIKPDLFGAFGAEIMVEYGWIHNESQSPNSNNPIGEFLDSSRCVEKYMITNSQFTVENNGQVNINLSIAMKGPIDIRQTEIFADVDKKVSLDQINLAIDSYNSEVGEFTENRGNTIQFNTITSGFTSLKSRKPVDEKILKRIRNIQNKLKIAKSICNKLEKQIPPRDRTFSLSGVSVDSVKFDFESSNLTSIDSDLKIFKKGNLVKPSQSDVINAFNSVFGLTSGDTGLKKKSSSSFELILPENSKFDKMIDVNERINSLINNIGLLITKNKNTKKLQKKFVDSLIGGTKFHDMFFDFNLHELIAKGGEEANINENKGLYWGPITKSNFVSLGTLISSLIATHMLPSGKYDEIQVLFNTVNKEAGLASSYNMRFQETIPDTDIGRTGPLNIASLLISRSDLESFLKKIFVSRNRLTLESLISQIITNFVITRDNPVYGLSKLFERESFDLPVKPLSKKNIKVQNKSVKEQLNYIYYGDKKDLYESNPRFVPPSIHMTFDALTSPDDTSKTICRITVYDRNDNPYQSMLDLYNQSFTEKTKNFRQLKELEYELKNKNLSEEDKKATIGKIENKLKELLHPDTGLFETYSSKGKTFYRFKTGFGFKDLKEKYKKIIPTATFATQNTALINASVATVNEGKLNTVYITRADRNNTSELNDKVILDMPLRILPAQASIETFGCPWINFGQYIFLDFETGTTLDNTYAVTGIQHTISPGTFKTRVSLSYGDVYGKYEGVADGFEQSLSKFGEGITEEESTNEKAKKTPQTSKKIPKMTLKNNRSRLRLESKDTIKSITLKDLLYPNSTTAENKASDLKNIFFALNLFKITYKGKDLFDIQDFYRSNNALYSRLKKGNFYKENKNTNVKKFLQKFEKILNDPIISIFKTKNKAIKNNEFLFSIKKGKSKPTRTENKSLGILALKNSTNLDNCLVELPLQLTYNKENVIKNGKYFKYLSLEKTEFTAPGDIKKYFSTLDGGTIKVKSNTPNESGNYFEELHENIKIEGFEPAIGLNLSVQFKFFSESVQSTNKKLSLLDVDSFKGKSIKIKSNVENNTSKKENSKKFEIILGHPVLVDYDFFTIKSNSGDLKSIQLYDLHKFYSINMFNFLKSYVYKKKSGDTNLKDYGYRNSDGSNIISSFYKPIKVKNLKKVNNETGGAQPSDSSLGVKKEEPDSTELSGAKKSKSDTKLNYLVIYDKSHPMTMKGASAAFKALKRTKLVFDLVVVNGANVTEKLWSSSFNLDDIFLDPTPARTDSANLLNSHRALIERHKDKFESLGINAFVYIGFDDLGTMDHRLNQFNPIKDAKQKVFIILSKDGKCKKSKGKIRGNKKSNEKKFFCSTEQENAILSILNSLPDKT